MPSVFTDWAVCCAGLSLIRGMGERKNLRLAELPKPWFSRHGTQRRRGEIFNLTWFDVDLSRGLIAFVHRLHGAVYQSAGRRQALRQGGS